MKRTVAPIVSALVRKRLVIKKRECVHMDVKIRFGEVHVLMVAVWVVSVLFVITQPGYV